MRFLGISLKLLFFAAFSFGQTVNHQIAVKISPYNNCFIYLGNYFGNGKQFADTAWLNEKGEGFFKGKKKLTSGVYFVASPKYKIMFELLMDSTQHFSITADTTNLNDVQIKGSVENTQYKRYVQKASPIVMQLNMLATKIQTTKPDPALIQQQQQLAKALQVTRDSFINEAPHSLLALMLVAGKYPEIPTGTVVKTHADTLKAGQYIKKHFWDDVAFNDDRLLYTPFFDPKIDNYFNLYVSPVADSVINDMQYILLYARTGKEMYPYLVTKFINRYFNPEHAGQNKVFLYLFNDFLMRGDTAIFDARSKKLISDRAYALMANRVGDAAPPLDLYSATDGSQTPLYSLKSAYTLVVFWEPDCLHCQKELPRIDSIYLAKWKALGLKIYAVNINAALIKNAENFVKEKKLSPDWVHVYQKENDTKKNADVGDLSFFQTYDISETPTLYLLDAQKRIVAKRLNIEQIDRLVDIKEKNSTVEQKKPK